MALPESFKKGSRAALAESPPEAGAANGVAGVAATGNDAGAATGTRTGATTCGARAGVTSGRGTLGRTKRGAANGLETDGATGPEDRADATGAGLSAAKDEETRGRLPIVLTARLGAGAVAGSAEACVVTSFSWVREAASGAAGVSTVLAEASVGNAGSIVGSSTGRAGIMGASGFAGDAGLSSVG